MGRTKGIIKHSTSTSSGSGSNGERRSI